MEIVIFLKMLLSVAGRVLVGVSFVFLCSLPAHAGSQKAFDKYDPPSDLILTLPDQEFRAEKSSPSINQNVAVRNNNETQTSALKSPPVKVRCNMDVIQNTLDDVPLSNRLFGKCGLQYHY
ncbi:MAG: hypothetical protein NTY50_00065 [Methylobacter sp.]|nr:hypothetical protein [Methylobacter sp.]